MNETDKNISKKERILDAAEELFATHGYDGVTLRQIANKAGVDVALANYHFGKKHNLFEATFFRRAQVLNDLRLESLQSTLNNRGSNLTVEDIVAAFLKPMQALQLSGDPGWENYFALVAYINSSRIWGKELMHHNFDPLVSRYISALQQALPDAPVERIHWCYQYLSGALTLTMANTGRIDRLSEGRCRSNDFQTAYDLMIPFVTQGLIATCAVGSAE